MKSMSLALLQLTASSAYFGMCDVHRHPVYEQMQAGCRVMCGLMGD